MTNKRMNAAGMNAGGKANVGIWCVGNLPNPAGVKKGTVENRQGLRGMMP